jgi:hypothetical protein
MKKILAVSAIIALVACGSDNGPTATRPHFASNITAAACGAGKFQATATWAVTGDWKAIFVGIKAGKDSSAHVTGAASATSTCFFPAASGERVYAILFPITVQADADLTNTIAIP